jgi:hypothetical protein
MTTVYALRRLIKLSFACTSWRKRRESLKESGRACDQQAKCALSVEIRVPYAGKYQSVVLKSAPSNRHSNPAVLFFAHKSTHRTGEHSALA